MLESVKIKNYAVIDEVEIEFGEGFNVFTGESGAGKSIIVDALSFCLGDRAEPSMIKTGKDKTIVESVFLIENPRIKEKIEKLGFSLENDRLIIRREYDISGKNKIMVNGFQEKVSRVSELSEVLVDFHGQHEHQSLLNQKTHINYLDSFGKFEKELKELSELYHNVEETRSRIKNLEEEISQKKAREDFLKYTIEELRNANLSENEDVELEEKFRLIANYEQVFNILQDSLSLLEDNEISALSLLGRATSVIRGGIRLNPLFEKFVSTLEDVQISVRSVVSEIRMLAEKLNFQPDEVERINSRLDQIRTLKRKYNKNSVNELIQYLSQCQKDLSTLEFGEEELENLRKQYESLVKELKRVCVDLSEKRMRKAKELDRKVEEKLKSMAMENAVFKTEFKYYKSEDSVIEINGVKVDVNERGIDRVEFLISVNPGEEPKPLKNVASGGEISRIMLAIKSVLADVSEVDMMVFDEIDVGIGGHTANVVGETIKNISKNQQIIVITHLPQVASKANHHYRVEKVFEGNSTRVIVKKLSSEERKYEIARMVGNETETGLRYAEELLRKS